MTQPVPATSRYRRSAQVDETRVGDRVVLYHKDSGTGLVLNPSGSLVWSALASPSTVDEVIDTLAAKYPAVERDRLSTDVNTYVDSLRGHDLVILDE